MTMRCDKARVVVDDASIQCILILNKSDAAESFIRDKLRGFQISPKNYYIHRYHIKIILIIIWTHEKLKNKGRRNIAERAMESERERETKNTSGNDEVWWWNQIWCYIAACLMNERIECQQPRIVPRMVCVYVCLCLLYVHCYLGHHTNKHTHTQILLCIYDSFSLYLFSFSRIRVVCCISFSSVDAFYFLSNLL